MGWRLNNWVRGTRGHKSGAGRACLFTMATYAADETRLCWASGRTLAADLECTPHQVYDHLRELQDRGFIEMVTRGNSHRPSTYRLLPPADLYGKNPAQTPAGLNENGKTTVHEENITPKREKEKGSDSLSRITQESVSRTRSTEGVSGRPIDRILAHSGFIPHSLGGRDAADDIKGLLRSGTDDADVIAYRDKQLASGRRINAASLVHHFTVGGVPGNAPGALRRRAAREHAEVHHDPHLHAAMRCSGCGSEELIYADSGELACTDCRAVQEPAHDEG